jgi:CDP-diacylglycerol--glycerol-3-phosphate 3-phosphatidyltransferase
MRYLHNILSASRILATPPCALLAVFEETRLAALILAVIVGVTDAVDGPLARRVGGVSPFGGLLDMTSDKVFLCTMAIVEGATGRAPVWAAAIITARELIVLSLRCFAAGHGRALPIAVFGKLKSFILYFMVPLALIPVSPGSSRGVAIAVWLLALAASLSAGASLIEYLVKMWGDLAADFVGRPSAAKR